MILKSKMQRKVIPQCQFGVGEWHNKKNDRNEWSDLWYPMSVMVVHQPKSAPGTHTKFSAPCTISTVQCLEHHKSSLCSMLFWYPCHHCTFYHLVSGLLGQGWKGSSLAQGWLPSERTGSGPQHHHQCPPNLSWAEPLSTWHGLLCALWWCSALLGLACWLPCESCMAAAVILAKRNHFSYDFAVGCQPANLLLTDDVVLLPPAIGPTLGASFELWALCHPLWRGGFSCTRPMAVYRDKSTGLMLIMEYLFAGPGYGPWRLSDFGSKGSTRMNIQLSNDYNT